MGARYDGNVRRLAIGGVLAAACGGTPPADVAITVDTSQPGAVIPDDYAGASYETSTLIGGAYFRADNAPLRAMFARLGVHHLRLGGNEADRGALPVQAEIDAALGFADAAAVPVIYTLRLATYDPAGAATTAHAILDDDAARIACFSIGNEPGLYLTGYPQYRDDFDAYVAAIADPRAHYCGADEFAGATDWVDGFAQDRGASLLESTVHEYFGGNGTTCDAAAARDRLLSSELVDEYQANHDAFAPATLASGTGFRISETNSYFNGGCIGASDTFASALWGLDYLYWWASHDARGLDFHTGDHVSGTSTTYALFTTSTGGYHVHPLGYAMAAFDLGAHGTLAPVTIDSASALTAYAVAGAGSVTVTIIDKAHDAGAAPLSIALTVPGATGATAWRLEAPAIDATDGITLGGAAIDDQGGWTGAPEAPAIDHGVVRLSIDPASAIVVDVITGP